MTISAGRRLRIAFVDMIFSWPPNGGADADLFNVAGGLSRRGHDVRLFVAHEPGSTERGLVDIEQVPFSVTRLEFSRKELAPAVLCPRFRDAVDEWHPDIVFLTHGFALKPYLALALAHYPVVGRFYAHELACARDALRFKDGQPCPYDYLRTPNICRPCALSSLGPQIRQEEPRTWAVDWIAAEAWKTEYHQIVLDSLRAYVAVIVSNRSLQNHVGDWAKRVEVFPGGAPVRDIQPAQAGRNPEKKVILATGRMEDPLKGLEVLLEAGRMLSKKRSDFEIQATHFDTELSKGYFKALGWMTYAESLELYRDADIVVVPSIWEEPFGLVAVEGMAAGLPVCASRTGGLADIIRDGETGFLFTPGNAAELAERLTTLLEDTSLRYRLGSAGRRVAEEEYDWDAVIERHYLPLIGELTG